MPSELTFRLVDTADDLLALQRVRYRIYCEEAKVAFDAADHERRLLPEAADERAVLLMALLDGEPCGCARLLFGRDGAIDEDHRSLLRVDDAERIAGIGRLVVIERLGMLSTLRGDGRSSIGFILEVVRTCFARGADVVLADCEPHLLALYRALGMRPSGPPVDLGEAINHVVVVPLLGLFSDFDHLAAIRSPLLPLAQQYLTGPCEPALLALLPQQANAAEEPAAAAVSLFDGLDDDARASLVAHADLLRFDDGARILTEARTNTTLYAVVEGGVRATLGGRQLAHIGSGDVFGHFAFLLRRPRTATVEAVGPTSVLALPASRVDELTEARPDVAVTVFRNLARSVAAQLDPRHDL